MEWKKLLSEKRIRDLFEKSVERKKDHRTEFDRDYDRAIFCTPVRRLHDKAQVFPLEPNDSVRTRLTHSLEVSTVARDMARTISRWIEKEKGIDEDQSRHIETIAATCGLIHDLGNPPFGHAGEEAIKVWFRQKKEKGKESFFRAFKTGNTKGSETKYALDFLNFEGNAQTLRLVSKLQVLADLYGLNFTCGTMSAACKYIAPSNKTEQRGWHEKKKVGYFVSEEDLIHLIRNETGTGGKRNPITFIVEAADDIVYSVVDLEDGVKKGVVNWESLKDLLEKYSKGDSKLLRNCFNSAEKMIEKGNLFDDNNKRSRGDALAQAFRVFAISKLVTATIEKYKELYDQIMGGDYHGELVEDSNASSLINACKEVGKRYIYCAEKNLRLELMGKKIIYDLMDVFWDGALGREGKPTTFPAKAYKLLSGNYRTVFEKALAERKLPKEYCCMQLVTDYICGMTDTFATTLHRELTNG